MESINKFVISTTKELGRHAIAGKELKPGELILCEKPIVIGLYWGSDLCCLSCYGPSMKICKKCLKVPLCFNCSTHDEDECNFFQKSKINQNFLLDNLDVISPIRVLLLGLNKSTLELYEKFMKMPNHLNERKGTDVWNFCKKRIVNPLMSSEIFCEFPVKPDEELIQKICGILDVNSLQIRGPALIQGYAKGNHIRGIFPDTSTLAHSCISNTLISIDSEHNLRLFSSVPIKKGEAIFNNYTSSLFNTSDRKLHLKEGKYMDCSCKRCSDPTEMGTNLSSIKCKECEPGLLTFDQKGTLWKCTECKNTKPSQEINELLSKIKDDIENIGMDLRELELSILKYSEILNPKHSFVIELKQNVAAILREIAVNNLSHPPKKVLKRKLELCEEILPILQSLQPGISRMTGIALYECHVPLVQLAHRNYESKEIKCEELLKNLIKAEIWLKDSVSMLIYEHPTTPEGKLEKRGMSELKELRETIKGVKGLVDEENLRNSKKANKKN